MFLCENLNPAVEQLLRLVSFCVRRVKNKICEIQSQTSRHQSFHFPFTNTVIIDHHFSCRPYVTVHSTALFVV